MTKNNNEAIICQPGIFIPGYHKNIEDMNQKELRQEAERILDTKIEDTEWKNSPQNLPVEKRIDPEWHKHPKEDKDNAKVLIHKPMNGPDGIYGSGQYVSEIQNRPDHRQYIFRTFHDNNIQVMYPNNIIMPIRLNYGPKDTFLTQFITNYGAGNDGIYILDEFLTSTLRADRVALESFLNYYRNSGVVLNDDRTIIKDLIEIITSGREEYVRIITFIPQKAFAALGAIYIRHTGLVVGYNLLNCAYIHPHSEEASYVASKVKKDFTNYITIDIINNKSKEDYYISAGKNIIKLESSKNLDKVEGASLNIYRDDACVISERCSLEELENVLGIYKSKEEALYNGDVLKAKEQLIQERKIDAEVLTSKMKYDKILHSSELEDKRFGNDMAREAAKKESIRLEMERERLKHETLNLKYTLDLKYDIQKHILDINKIKLDTDKLNRDSIFSTVQTISKLLNLVGGLF